MPATARSMAGRRAAAARDARGAVELRWREQRRVTRRLRSRRRRRRTRGHALAWRRSSRGRHALRRRRGAPPERPFDACEPLLELAKLLIERLRRAPRRCRTCANNAPSTAPIEKSADALTASTRRPRRTGSPVPSVDPLRRGSFFCLHARTAFVPGRPATRILLSAVEAQTGAVTLLRAAMPEPPAPAARGDSGLRGTSRSDAPALARPRTRQD